MAGVAGPMLRRTRAEGARFLIGLALGGVAAGLMLSLPAYLAGTVLHQVVPVQARLLLLAAISAVLGVADLMRRTPHVQRQVPESLFHKLAPGSLGLAWGFDLGLLFTTQKTTSLIWVALAAVVLVGPSWAAIVPVAIALVASLAIVVRTLTVRVGPRGLRLEVRWFGLARRMSGAVILALLAVTVLQTLQA